MDRKSKVLFVVLILVVIFIIGYKFKEFVIDKNFLVYSITTCNPEIESCFVSDCDPSDLGCDIKPYKKIERIDKYVPNCSTPEDCFTMSCSADEPDCVVTHCDENNLEEGESCVGPETTPTRDQESSTTPNDQVQ